MNMNLEKGMLMLLLIWTVAEFGISYSLGKHAGYDQALRDLPPVIKTTDQQCVAWLFESTMKDVKKRICK